MSINSKYKYYYVLKTILNGAVFIVVEFDKNNLYIKLYL